MSGQTHEDVSSQLAAVARAAGGVRDALRAVEEAAKRARRSRDLPPVYGAVAVLRRAEEALDLAQLDYRTASGEDA